MSEKLNLVELKAKKLVGISTNMSLVENKTFQLFSSFMPLRKEIKHTTSSDVYEVLIYNESYFKSFNSAKTFTKWATVEVEKYENIPESMKTFNLEGGLYAVFHYKGLAKNIGKLMTSIYTKWLPKSDYTLDNRPHFNQLGKKTKRNDPNSEEYVWIPIKKRP